jgi:hypothetical protein
MTEDRKEANKDQEQESSPDPAEDGTRHSEQDGDKGKDQGPEPGTSSSAGSGQGTQDLEPASGDKAGPEPGEDESPEAAPHPYEALLDEYPLRDPSEDPVWSVRIVKGWMYFVVFNIVWIVVFLILGVFIE